MPLTDRERALFAQAREYVAAERLPRTVPNQSWLEVATMRCVVCATAPSDASRSSTSSPETTG